MVPQNHKKIQVAIILFGTANGTRNIQSPNTPEDFPYSPQHYRQLSHHLT